MFKRSPLNGNWEVSYIGMRIEISNNNIIFLWRSSPVLETKFKTKEEDGKLYLALKNNGLRYAGSGNDYASVTELYLENDVLHLKEFFPITGESTDELRRTENSRYGAYDIVDKDVLPELQGKWIDEKGHYDFEISGNTLTLFGMKIKIRVLKSRSQNDEYKVVDIDPAKDYLGVLSTFTYTSGVLTAYEPICDATPEKLVFKKI